MCGVGILTKSIVADYYEKYSNRHQERNMPETVFFVQKERRLNNKNPSKALHSSFISTAAATINQ